MECIRSNITFGTLTGVKATTFLKPFPVQSKCYTPLHCTKLENHRKLAARDFFRF